MAGIFYKNNTGNLIGASEGNVKILVRQDKSETAGLKTWKKGGFQLR